ncbi:hypothetical protein V5799_023248 [Amblyomma americanum]|uniref:Sulfotransferase domain-containing protein n=1 Tax=Amblyomma americanum TaxID=6943 RepID=A0AAQ4FI75_AMBAM
MDAQDPEDQLELALRLPFLDMQGAEAAVYAPRPAAFKTHLPFHKVPYSPEAKYIYITRNPYDCCVSFFYHTRNNAPYRFNNGTFDEFFELFLQGKVDYGHYFDNVLSWYDRRNSPNVLFVTYEELKTGTEETVLKIATFIGEDVVEKLRNNHQLLQRILDNTSFESMKLKWGTSAKGPVVPLAKMLGMKSVRPELQKGLRNVAEFKKEPLAGDFIRKGQVGDWREHFSPGQILRMKEVIEKETTGTGLMDLWKGVDIP